MHNYTYIQSNLNQLIKILNSYISEEYKNELKEYLSYNELGIVYQDLCEMILLLSIPISLANYQMIEKLGRMMEFPDKIWEPLKKFVKAENKLAED